EIGGGAESGIVLSGYDLREAEHPLSSGLGAVERRGAHADESHDADSQARVESTDGGTGGVSQADEPVVHPDDARAAEGWQAGAQGRSAGDEKTQQDHSGARGAAPGNIGTTLAGNGSDRGGGAADFGADQDGRGEVAGGDSPGA